MPVERARGANRLIDSLAEGDVTDARTVSGRTTAPVHSVGAVRFIGPCGVTPLEMLAIWRLAQGRG
jgi:hypothetical protein